MVDPQITAATRSCQHADTTCHYCLGQHLVDILDIISQPAHQVAMRSAWSKEAQR